ncbi:MAG TPA: hypothetical protein VN616_14735 [Puia sp.]|nr:hypothetical protein [Puia sp.]
MYSFSARRGHRLLVIALLLISILLEQAIAAFFPLFGLAGGVRPMVVFLDIPLEAPLTIDWLPVGFAFLMFCGLTGTGRGREKPPGEIRRPGWGILGWWWLLLIIAVAAGGLFGALSPLLPKVVRNGLDSFGIRADLVLPYPSGEIIHLHGSMFMLLGCWLGWRGLIRSALPANLPAQAPPSRPAAPAIASPPAVLAAASPPPALPPQASSALHPSHAPGTPGARGRIAMRIPDPVEIKAPSGRPCVYVSMPDGFRRKRHSYPCVVDGAISPTAGRPF